MIKEIRYVQSIDIDRARWDEAINNAPNGFVYCQSFFLDAMCKWDALILGDFDYLMPLPHNSKWGIQYIYTPYFVGQLGIISKHTISAELVRVFLDSIPSKFKYIDLHLNEANALSNFPGASIVSRNNYVLSLKDSYPLIESKFTKDGKKNLRKAATHQLEPVENIDPKLVIEFFKNAYGNLNSGIKEENYLSFETAMTTAVKTAMGFTFGIKSGNEGLVAVAFLGKDAKRIYYMAGAPNAVGRVKNAQHVLIDALIKKYAGQKLFFDFEGSDIPSVANFYKKFSPELMCYPQIKINRLPFFLKWLKK